MKRKAGIVVAFKSPKELADLVNFYVRRVLRVKLYRYLLIAATLIVLAKFHFGPPSDVRLPTDINLDKFPPFEPEVTPDFPPGEGSVSQIPRIIHQTWVDANIPPKFVSNIKSFSKNNPDWQYYLWTDEALSLFIKKHFTELIPLWDSYIYSYHHPLRRFNAARYMIMYVYGGVFVDMDTVNYRSLDPVIHNHNCIIPPEPFEQTYFSVTSLQLTNSIMMCRAKHPFFAQVVDNLHRYLHLTYSWDSAGPGYLTSQYKLYAAAADHADEAAWPSVPGDTRPYMVRGDFSLADPDAVYVPNSRYFSGNSDINVHNRVLGMCNSFETLHTSVQRVCVNLKTRGIVRGRNKFTYTEHLWQNNWYGLSNFYLYTKLYQTFFGTDIHRIVPHCKVPFVVDKL